MGFCERAIALRQRKDCRIAVFSLDRGKLRRFLVFSADKPTSVNSASMLSMCA